MNKVIISDTSCLIALDRIDKLSLLNKLFETVFITPEVQLEFGKNLPEWIEIKTFSNHIKFNELRKILDLGEASTISLCLETEDSLLIIDEMKGRKVAQSYGLEIIGTVGVLVLAKNRALIDDLIDVLGHLRANGFRVSQTLIDFIKQKNI